MKIRLQDPTGDPVDVEYVGRILADQGVPHAIITNGDTVVLEAADLLMPKVIACVQGLGLDARPYRGDVDVPGV